MAADDAKEVGDWKKRESFGSAFVQIIVVAALLAGVVYFVWQNGMIARLNNEMNALAEKPRLLKPAGVQHVGFEGAFQSLICIKAVC